LCRSLKTDRPLRVNNVSKRYGIPERTVRWNAKHGLLKGSRKDDAPKIWIFLPQDVEAWIAGRHHA
jgi:hypothetical protein